MTGSTAGAAVERLRRRPAAADLLTPHLGCFEVIAQGYAVRSERAHAADDRAVPAGRARTCCASWSQTARAAAGPAHSRRPTCAGVRMLMRALQARARCSASCPTRCRSQGEGVWAPFFGRPAYTMTLAGAAGAQTGAAIVLLLAPSGCRARRRLSRARSSALAAPLAGDAARRTPRRDQPRDRDADPRMPGAVPVGLQPLQAAAGAPSAARQRRA
ncbi:MAG: hypothetical protein MZW92_39685 [Comamonadaceae bacterium]|nr:hypothetical protein [Comamonadaceae bacterium]